MNFCYEAGGCGYEVYYQLKKHGQECDVVASGALAAIACCPYGRGALAAIAYF